MSDLAVQYFATIDWMWIQALVSGVTTHTYSRQLRSHDNVTEKKVKVYRNVISRRQVDESSVNGNVKASTPK